LQALKEWTLTPDELSTINLRSNDLSGEQDWLPPVVDLMNKTFRLKAVDFVRMSRGAMTYVFEGVFAGEKNENKKQAFDSFNETLRRCLTTHFNADGLPHTTHTLDRVGALMEQVSETMSLLEMSAPLIFFDRLLHELIHIPMSLLRWNSCRNFWAFRSERYRNMTYTWPLF
jgi:hypothetical protein